MSSVSSTRPARSAPAVRASKPSGSESRRVSLRRRSVLTGIAAALAMATVYALIVGLASGSVRPLEDQAAADRYLLLAVFVGFGTQVAFLTELRRRHRLRAAAAATGGASAGASVAGMVACCSHHVADLLPVLGASGAAAFLYDYRLLFVVFGLGANAVGVFVAWRRLHRLVAHSGEVVVCDA